MGAAPRRRLSRDARRAELLGAAEALFSARPFDEVSLDDLAAEAGIHKNLIYHYFSSKRELFLCVIAETAEAALQATEPDLTLEPIERLRASLDAHLAYVSDHAAGYAALIRGSSADQDAQAILTGVQDRAVARTLDSLGLPAEPPPEVVLTVRGWIAFVDAVSVRWLSERPLPREAVRDLLADQFVALVTAAVTAAARPAHR